MLNEYKEFWKKYIPYQLHPDDEKEIGSNDKKLVNIDINFFTQKYSNNLKNKENDQDFQSQFDPKAIHTNMYCKPFIGNIEEAKIFILYGNPGLALGDYQDEHHDQKYIKKLNQELNFVSDGFLYLDEVSKNTGGYKYWKTENRFKNIIDQYSLAKDISYVESFNEIKKSICLLESIGYHSTRTPYFKPQELPSSRMNKRLVHEYLLPKAQRGEIFIFSWRQSSFWDLTQSKNVLLRDKNTARNSYFSSKETSEILEFLNSGLRVYSL